MIQSCGSATESLCGTNYYKLPSGKPASNVCNMISFARGSYGTAAQVAQAQATLTALYPSVINITLQVCMRPLSFLGGGGPMC